MKSDTPGPALPVEPADLTVEVSGEYDPAVLDLRLAQLEREWDVDRAFLAGGACAGLLGVLLGGLRNRLYLALPLAIFGFTWQRVSRGTCAPMEWLRSAGFRSALEIQEERAALKAVRRDLRVARRRRSKKSA